MPPDKVNWILHPSYLFIHLTNVNNFALGPLIHSITVYKHLLRQAYVKDE